MDLDSDYCSNDSDVNLHNSSRTPTPPKSLLNQKLSEKHVIPDNSLIFLVGKNGERMEVYDKDLILNKLPVLKNKLSQRSSSGDGKMTQIKLLDFEPQILKPFLNYLRTDEFKTGEISDFPGLLRLCIEYQFPRLLDLICPLVKQNITLDNCVQLYVLSAANDLEDLRLASFNYFLRLGNSFIEHPSFLELDCVTLSILIASDDFPVVEVTLFKRLYDWVVNQCKRLGYPPDRKEFFGRVAGLVFKQVRYSQMTPKEFRTEVLGTGVLCEKEIEAINLRHRTHPGFWYILPPYQFVDRPRMNKLQFAVPLYNNVQIGFRKIAGAKSTIQESVRFLVSHDIYLTSIGFFGPAKSDQSANGSSHTAYSIKIHVEGDYAKYHSRCPAQNASVVTRENFTVDLSHPFFIQRLQPYKLTVWMDGEATQFGVFPLPQAVVLVQDKGEFITFHFGDADTDPKPVLQSSGAPSSFAPLIRQNNHNHSNNNNNNFNNHRAQYKQDPRISGVIRCIAFVLKD